MGDHSNPRFGLQQSRDALTEEGVIVDQQSKQCSFGRSYFSS